MKFSTDENQLLMNEYVPTLNWVHHISPLSLFTINPTYSLYSNVGMSAFSTADFTSMSTQIQTWMGTSMSQASMAATPLLGAQMASMSMKAPSMMALSTCMAMMSIEMNTTDPRWQAVKMNRTNFYTHLYEKKDENDTTGSIAKMNFKEINPYEAIDRNEKGVLRTMIGVTLIAVSLFSKLSQDDIVLQNDSDKNYNTPIELQNQCFDLAHTIGFAQVSTNSASYVRSACSTICAVLLGMPFCAWDQGGQGINMIYYQHLSTEANNQIHNTFFKNRFPQKQVMGNRTAITANSLYAYFARYMFCYKYSNFEVYVKYAQDKRCKLEKKFNNLEDNIPEYLPNETFEAFLFQNATKLPPKRRKDENGNVIPKNEPDDNPNTDLFDRISFDSISEMITNHISIHNKNILEISEYEKFVEKEFQEFVKFANDYCKIYIKIIDILKTRKCTFTASPLTGTVSNNFFRQIKEDFPFNKKYLLNPILFADNTKLAINTDEITSKNEILFNLENTPYTDTRLNIFSTYDDTILCREQKNIFHLTIGDNVALGFLYVGQYKSNYNNITFDMYVKIMAQYQIMKMIFNDNNKEFQSFKKLFENKYSNMMNITNIDSLELEKFFDEQPFLENEFETKQSFIESIQPLNNYLYSLGNYLEAWKIRSIYNKI